jgi:branched-chain amino acid aminotransferase
MRSPLVYLNGRFMPFQQARLPLHDAGFVSGATVVDNVRTFRHKLFRWSDHLARFRRDCSACYVPLEPNDEQITAIAEELVAHNAKLLPPRGELQLVTFATPGPLGVYVRRLESGPPTLGMVTYSLPFERYRPFYTDGVTLAVIETHATDSTLLPPTVKHRSRMAWHIADQLARARTGNPAALGVPLSGRGETLTETSIGHFLAVIDGAVTTPPRPLVLDGISLRVMEELCRTAGIPFAEALLPLSTRLQGSEVMLTGTGFCLAGVREIGPQHGAPIHCEWPGPVFRRLLAAWSDLVGVDIEGQFTRS